MEEKESKEEENQQTSNTNPPIFSSFDFDSNINSLKKKRIGHKKTTMKRCLFIWDTDFFFSFFFFVFFIFRMKKRVWVLGCSGDPFVVLSNVWQSCEY